jgi:hypothetical protein
MPLFRSQRRLVPLAAALVSLAVAPAAQAADFNLNVDIQGAGKVAEVGVPANECDAPLDTPDSSVGKSCAFGHDFGLDPYTASFDAVPPMAGWRLKAWHGCTRVVNDTRCEFDVPGLRQPGTGAAVAGWALNGPRIRAEFEDIAAPETTVTAGPARLSRVKSPTFDFTADQDSPGAGFHCKLDDQPAEPCQSPKQYFAVPNGRHRFQVFATDPSLHSDPTPAEWTWTIDTVPPRITSTYPQVTNRATDTITYDNGGAVAMSCSLDHQPVSNCPLAGYPVAGLADGHHTLELTGTDLAGNKGSALIEWTVDTQAPDTRIVSASTPDTSAGFEFASEPGARHECSLDGARFEACASPTAFGGLRVGAHTFSVRAIDAAGNEDPSPARHAWTATAPSVPAAPAGPAAGTPAPVTGTRPSTPSPCRASRGVRWPGSASRASRPSASRT